MSDLPDYDRRKALARLYGWELSGWVAEPTADSTVLLVRWELPNGTPVAPPPTELRQPGNRTFYTSPNGEKQMFIRMPYFGSLEDWIYFLKRDPK